jgi:hypothetical protein
VATDGSKGAILYAVTKDFGLHHLIGHKQFVGNRLLALVSKPLTTGVFLADSYRTSSWR